MLQQALAVFFVLGLLVAALWLLRRHGMANIRVAAASSRFLRKRGGDQHMRVVERLILTAHHSLHLVEVNHRLIVFAASPAGCEVMDLASLDSAKAMRADSRSSATC